MLQQVVVVLACAGEWRHVRSTQCVIGRHMGELSRGPECRSFGFAAGGGVRAERGEDTLLRESKTTKSVMCMLLEELRSMTMIRQKKVESGEVRPEFSERRSKV